VRSTAIRLPAAPLTDGIVSLRYRRDSDLDAICAASHDPDSLRWLADQPMDAEARATSMARVAEAFRIGRSAPLVIADSATDQPIGLLNVQFRDDHVATIAYSVFPGFRGQGVAPRAVRLAVHWAFSDLGLSEILLEIDPGNLSPVRVAEKCGFEPAGRVLAREQGGDGDSDKLLFAISKGQTWPRADSSQRPNETGSVQHDQRTAPLLASRPRSYGRV
jgi:RimJ/RimL family protein N-acetyltransferase